jgi:O-antigen/teichoic acid export membrane protein
MPELSPALAPAAHAEAPPAAPAESGAAVARNAAHLVLGQIALTALSFVLSGALGRALGPVEFGLFFFILSTTNFAYTFVDWGQSHVLIREIARRREQTGSLLGSALALRGVGALLAAAGTWAALWAFRYESRTGWLTTLYIVLWIPSTAWMAYGMAFRAHERMDADAKVSVFNKALTLGLTLPALALGGRLVWAIGAVGAAGVGALGFAVAQARKIRFPRLSVGTPAVRELLWLGGPLVLMNLLNMAQTYMEPLLLSKLAPEEVLGWYGAARTIANALIMPASIIASASFPRLARASADPGRLRSELSTAMRPVLALAVLVGAGTWAFASFAIGVVYGADRFSGAAIILQAIGPTLSIMFPGLVLSTTVLIAGKAKQVAAFKVLALAISAGLAYGLVPYTQRQLGNGAVGVIVAFGASEALMLVGYAILMPAGILERRLFADLLRACGAGALALAAIAVLPWANAFVAMPVFLLAFAAGALGLRLFSRDDLSAFAAAIRRRGEAAAPADPGPPA